MGLSAWRPANTEAAFPLGCFPQVMHSPRHLAHHLEVAQVVLRSPWKRVSPIGRARGVALGKGLLGKEGAAFASQASEGSGVLHSRRSRLLQQHLGFASLGGPYALLGVRLPELEGLRPCQACEGAGLGKVHLLHMDAQRASGRPLV